MQLINHFDRLYGERASQPDADFLFSEKLETRSLSFGWDIKPHIHPRLYQLFFVEKGKFQFFEASKQMQLEGPCLLIIPPTILHGFVYDSDVTGRILSLSDKMFDSLFSESKFLIRMLRNLRIIKISDEHYSPEKIKLIIETIDEELFNSYSEKSRMLRACLQQLILVMYRLWNKNEASISESDNKSLQYLRKFQQQIFRAGKIKTIAQLADELAITPEHLNRICRLSAGKSASQLVHEHRLEEAQKYLIYTSYSISEIAYLLNFEYPNYFARFFRKHIGLSPKQFRKQKGRSFE